jgi:hypothetical protein
MGVPQGSSSGPASGAVPASRAPPPASSAPGGASVSASAAPGVPALPPPLADPPVPPAPPVVADPPDPVAFVDPPAPVAAPVAAEPVAPPMPCELEPGSTTPSPEQPAAILTTRNSPIGLPQKRTLSMRWRCTKRLVLDQRSTSCNPRAFRIKKHEPTHHETRADASRNTSRIVAPDPCLARLEPLWESICRSSARGLAPL